MRVLLDECCRKPLKNYLPGFEVFTVEQADFKGLKNGDLLSAAIGKFDVLITADKNLRYQQNLKGRTLAIIELPMNSWKRLKPLVPGILAALSRIKAGQYLVVPLEISVAK